MAGVVTNFATGAAYETAGAESVCERIGPDAYVATDGPDDTYLVTAGEAQVAVIRGYSYDAILLTDGIDTMLLLGAYVAIFDNGAPYVNGATCAIGGKYPRVAAGACSINLTAGVGYA